MLGIDRQGAGSIIIVLGSVFIFESLPRFQVVGKYFEQYPIIIFIIGVALIIFNRKLGDTIGG
jgi:hypothetical protein